MEDFTKEIKQIETLFETAFIQVGSAAAQRDFKGVRDWANRLSKLVDLIDAFEAQLRGLANGSQTPASSTQPQGTTKPRTLAISVTQGDLNQSLLRLTEQKRQGVVQAGETFAIELPSGETFQTSLLPDGKVRERRRIKKFYRDAGVQAGDIVVLCEVSAGCWQLRKRP
jgi:hypothetical protein